MSKRGAIHIHICAGNTVVGNVPWSNIVSHVAVEVEVVGSNLTSDYFFSDRRAESARRGRVGEIRC